MSRSIDNPRKESVRIRRALMGILRLLRVSYWKESKVVFHEDAHGSRYR